MKNTIVLLLISGWVSLCYAQTLNQAQITLGQQLFFDTLLSKHQTQSCSSCHNPARAFTDDRENSTQGALSLGDDDESFGKRNTPSAAYASFSPAFHFDNQTQQWIGGQFWDGRAANLTEQAKQPILDPLEMMMPDEQSVVERLKAHPLYSQTMRQLYGQNVFDNPELAYQKMAQSIAAFEKSELFSPFDSKYDRYLSGEYQLTPLEDLGRALFFSNNNTSCSSCHQLQTLPDSKGETFSNYEYHNIGVPTNHKANTISTHSNVDEGLFANPAVTDNAQRGKFKVPSLRNVAVTPPYMHNGVFQALHTVVSFYDHFVNPKRNINPETGNLWQLAEIEQTVNLTELTAAKPLNKRKIDALIAFLHTLTDKRYEHLLPKKISSEQ